LSIAGATAAIDDQTWLHETVAKIKRTRQRLTSGLEGLGFRVIPSQANFVWATHPNRPAESLYQQLKASRILVRYMNYPEWGDGLRISVGSDEQIDALLALLKTMV
jgi:histidinol-phosphate aminotransferase